VLAPFRRRARGRARGLVLGQRRAASGVHPCQRSEGARASLRGARTGRESTVHPATSVAWGELAGDPYRRGDAGTPRAGACSAAGALVGRRSKATLAQPVSDPSIALSPVASAKSTPQPATSATVRARPARAHRHPAQPRGDHTANSMTRERGRTRSLLVFVARRIATNPRRPQSLFEPRERRQSALRCFRHRLRHDTHRPSSIVAIESAAR
jgi:hypothetical protein